MIVRDFNGEANVRTKKELERRLTSLRRGNYGAFVLAHAKDGPSLWIHIFKAMAYLHYFPNPDYLIHAGYQATGMTPPECKGSVCFQVIDGESIDMPCSAIVSVTNAVIAAKEFFADPVLPPSIEWLEV
jgi:Immunity protein Imm1